MKKYVLLFTLFVFGTSHAESAGDILQAKLNAIRTMSANFSQVVKAKEREVSRSSGSMAMSRPGRFRWQTKSPMAQLVVADSQKLWIYDVDLEQVTVKKQEKGLGGTPALFLSGYDNTVTRDFEVTALPRGELEVYDLISKSKKANFQRVKLVFSGEILKGLELFDQLGQHTVVQLTHIKNNPKLAANVFEFKPPKGVDVVRQ